MSTWGLPQGCLPLTSGPWTPILYHKDIDLEIKGRCVPCPDSLVPEGKGWCRDWHIELRVEENSLYTLLQIFMEHSISTRSGQQELSGKPLCWQAAMQKSPDLSLLASLPPCSLLPALLHTLQLPQVLFLQSGEGMKKSELPETWASIVE